MADAIISILLERVTAIVEGKIRSEVSFVRGVQKELLQLANKLKTVKNVLEDAERRGVKEKSVSGWLKKLEDTAYEMDDILDEWNYYAIHASLKEKEKVCCSFIPSSCLRRHIAKRIQNVKASLDEILKEKNEFNFVISIMPTTYSDPRSETTSSVDLENVEGQDIERNKNEIVRKLVGGDRQILSIVGMGGIGKTTLAQLVYNDSRVKDCFDLRLWICVSDSFDVAGIARGIVETVVRDQNPLNTNRLEVLMERLKDSVREKKFLLVLDDVWNEDPSKWEPLMVNLKCGAASSKILVTTRNERVAKMMGSSHHEIYRPRQLTDEESWSLLLRISLRGKEGRGGFENVGKEIALKCKGLPLAVNVLGRVLQLKNSLEEWENVLKSEIWDLDEAEVDIFPHLLLSYNELSPTLKRCFSYCVVYSKGSEIKVEILIQRWMALGYLGSDVGSFGVELKGRQYFKILAMRSLFQDFGKDGTGKIWSCKMHDIVHDFAQFIRKNRRVVAPGTTKRVGPCLVSHAQECHTLHWNKNSPPILCDCLKSLRVLELDSMNRSPRRMEKLIHLRWLHISGTVLSNEDLKTIFKLYFLQTLMIRVSALEEIPSEIGNLVHLRHLNLNWNIILRKLPESICNLVELQTLDIENCWNLHTLPKGLAQLSGLTTLNGFPGGNGCKNFRLLKNLNNLSESLKLEVHVSSSIDIKELVEDAREAELRSKIRLQRLIISFNCYTCPPSFWVELIEALEPNQNLQILKISEYKGTKLPCWISSPLNLVRQICLADCSMLLSLPPVGKLPFLEILTMIGMKELKILGVEWLGIRGRDREMFDIQSSSLVAFPKLKILEIGKCHKWLEWEDITAEEEESTTVSVMPCLMEVYVFSCKDLKMLPHRLLRKAASLKLLDIRDSSQLIQCYGDKNGSPWRSISRINPQLVLSCSST